MTRLEQLNALIAAGLGDVEPVCWLREVERLRSENARLQSELERTQRRELLRDVQMRKQPERPRTEIEERRWLLAELCGWRAQPWQERHAECVARRIA